MHGFRAGGGFNNLSRNSEEASRRRACSISRTLLVLQLCGKCLFARNGKSSK